MVVLVRRHRHAVGTAVRRAVDDEVPGAVEGEMYRVLLLPLIEAAFFFYAFCGHLAGVEAPLRAGYYGYPASDQRLNT